MQSQSSEITTVETITTCKDKVDLAELRSEEVKGLTARVRHRTDCRLLACLLVTVCLMSSSGVSLVTLYIVYRDSVDFIKPLVVVGAVLLGASCLVFCCILEVVMRICQYQSSREGGEDSIQHWCPPDMIPFGWGHFNTRDMRAVNMDNPGQCGENKSAIKSANQSVKVQPLKSSESDMAEQAHMEEKEDVKSDIVKIERHSPVSIELRNVESKENTQSEEKDESRSETELVVTLCESPHRLMATLDDDLSLDLPSMQQSDPLVTSDVYSRSLRFSHIERPEFIIDRSSPLMQKRGSFADEEDRILNLFSRRIKSAKL